MIVIASKHRKADNLLKQYPGALIVDVTSRAQNELVKLSPFYPHGGIPGRSQISVKTNEQLLHFSREV